MLRAVFALGEERHETRNAREVIGDHNLKPPSSLGNSVTRERVRNGCYHCGAIDVLRESRLTGAEGATAPGISQANGPQERGTSGKQGSVPHRR